MPDAPQPKRPAGLRVALLTTSYPAHAGDTAGLFVQGFAETLVGLGHHVRVVAPALDQAPDDVPTASAQAPSRHTPALVERLTYAYPRALQRTFHRAGAPENLRRDPLAALGALTYPLALLRHLAPLEATLDVVVSHWAVPSGYVATLTGTRRASGVRRVRRVVVTHGADIHLLARMPLGATVARRIVRESDALTFVSQAHLQRFEALVQEAVPHAAVLAMGVPEVSALPAGVPDLLARAPLRGTVVLTLGRLVPIKGLDVLIDALRGVPSVTLVIAGDGPARAELAQRAARAGVSTLFPGVVLGAEKAAWLAAADVFVLPSRRLASGREEGAPTALLEAMLAGVKVVATRTGGVAELLGHGQRGTLVPAESVQALRAALTDAIAQPERARERALRAQTFAHTQTWEALSARLDALVRGT